MVAFYLPGGVPVYAFSLIVGTGTLLGLGWVAWQSGESALARVNAGLWTALGALVGGRAVYVGMAWLYYRQNPAETWQVFLGGLAWPGAVGGALLALAGYAWWHGQRLGALADELLPLGATLVVSAWLGCWLDGCAYGPVTQAGWGVPAVDEWGVRALRWPLQLLGALFTLELFWLLDWSRSRFPKAGQVSSLALLGIASEMLAFSFLRVDPAPFWQGLRADAWAALGFGALAMGSLLYIRKL